MQSLHDMHICKIVTLTPLGHHVAYDILWYMSNKILKLHHACLQLVIDALRLMLSETVFKLILESV